MLVTAERLHLFLLFKNECWIHTVHYHPLVLYRYNMWSAAYVLSKNPKTIAEFTPNIVLSLHLDHTVRDYLTHFNIYISANSNYVQQMVFYCKSIKKERRLRLLNLLLPSVSQFSNLPLTQVEKSTNLLMSLPL